MNVQGDFLGPLPKEATISEFIPVFLREKWLVFQLLDGISVPF